MNQNLITVTAQIGKCVYHVEMDQKNTYQEMITEIREQLDLTHERIKIIKYGKAHETTDNSTGFSQNA